MKERKSYRQLNKDLEKIIYELDNEFDDIDKAIELYGEGEKVLKQLDEYLKEAKIKIDKAKSGKHK